MLNTPNKNFQIHTAQFSDNSLGASTVWCMGKPWFTRLHCSATSDQFNTIFSQLCYKVYHHWSSTSHHISHLDIHNQYMWRKSNCMFSMVDVECICLCLKSSFLSAVSIFCDNQSALWHGVVWMVLVCSMSVHHQNDNWPICTYIYIWLIFVIYMYLHHIFAQCDLCIMW